MPRASSLAVTAPAKRHGSGPPPLPCPPGPRCGSHGHLALRPAAALPAGLPPLVQTLARAPPGARPPALARRTFSKQSGSLCPTPSPSEAAPCSGPTSLPATPFFGVYSVSSSAPGPHNPHLWGAGSCLYSLVPDADVPVSGEPSTVSCSCPFLEQGSRYWGGWKVSCSVRLSPNPWPRQPLSESPSVSTLLQLSSCCAAL